MHEKLFTVWGQLAAKNLWLSLGVPVLALCFLVDTGLRVREALQGPAAYLVPPGGPGIVPAGVISDGAATDYTTRWFQERYTFTPETIDQVHSVIKASLHPTLTVGFEVQRKDEAKAVKHHKMSSQATAFPATILRRDGLHVTVQVAGLQTIYIGQEPLPQEPVSLTLVLAPWPSSGTPSGIRPVRITEHSPVARMRR